MSKSKSSRRLKRPPGALPTPPGLPLPRAGVLSLRAPDSRAPFAAVTPSGSRERAGPAEGETPLPGRPRGKQGSSRPGECVCEPAGDTGDREGATPGPQRKDPIPGGGEVGRHPALGDATPGSNPNPHPHPAPQVRLSEQSAGAADTSTARRPLRALPTPAAPGPGRAGSSPGRASTTFLPLVLERRGHYAVTPARS